MRPKPKSKVRLSERRKRESYVLYGVYAVLILALVGGTAYVTHLPALRISQVSVEGTQFADAGEVEALTRDTLASSYAFLVPKDLRYVVPKGAVVERVVAALPIVESARVTERGQVLTVSVVERTPEARYCTKECYRMDAYGFIFDTTHGDSVLTEYRGGQLGIRETYLDGNFHDLHATIRALEGVLGARITNVLVDESNDVFARLESGGEIRFVLGVPEDKLAADLRAILTSKLFANGAALEYVELRFGNKAAVKLKE